MNNQNKLFLDALQLHQSGEIVKAINNYKKLTKEIDELDTNINKIKFIIF